ncbi:hypothetical protein [Azospirillum ramasamyi]|nr:hypothetical protein [Azospirillum ramasamyi]
MTPVTGKEGNMTHQGVSGPQQGREVTAGTAFFGPGEVMLGAIAMLDVGTSSRLDPDLLVLSTRALGDRFDEWAGTAAASAEAGASRTAAGLRERLDALLGEAGRAIADRAKSDLESNAWGKAPTAYYDLRGVEPRPISAIRAAQIRRNSRITTQMGLRPEGAIIERYVGGRRIGRFGGKEAFCDDLNSWLAGGALRPVVTAAAIAASIQGLHQPGRVHCREIEVAALVQGARRIDGALGSLSLPRADRDRASAALRSVEEDGMVLGRAGIETLTVDVADPVDVMILAGRLPPRLLRPGPAAD